MEYAEKPMEYTTPASEEPAEPAEETESEAKPDSSTANTTVSTSPSAPKESEPTKGKHTSIITTCM